jgi:hypothetical protein
MIDPVEGLKKTAGCVDQRESADGLDIFLQSRVLFMGI